MKQYYCFLERFNNYFNRKIIKYETLAEYENASKDFFIPVNSDSEMLPFDFNPNDNITTEIIANDIPFDPDYFLLLDEDATIVQRWFVIEQKRNRQGQWLYQLKRDVISDNLETLLDAPIFVEKGMLAENDPFILNDEGMSFNQVKQEEKFIKDETGTAWIVGYMAKNTDGQDININIPEQVAEGVVLTAADVASKLGITEAALSNVINYENEKTNGFKASKKISFAIGSESSAGTITYYDLTFDSKMSNSIIPPTLHGHGTGALFSLVNLISDDARAIVRQCFLQYGNNILSDLPSIFSNEGYYFSYDDLQKLFDLQGKYIYYASKYYVINILEGGDDVSEKSNTPYASYSSLKNVADDIISAFGTPASLYSLPTYSKISLDNKVYYICLNEVSASDVISGYEFAISGSRTPTYDQEFDMFCIPLDAGLLVQSIDKSISFTTISGVALKAAAAIAKELGKELYDIQLLPYCPLEDVMYGNYFDLDRILANENAGQIPYSIIGLTSQLTGNISVTLNGPVGYHGPVGYGGYSTWYLNVSAETFGLPTGTTFTGMTYSYSDPNSKVTSVSYVDVLDADNNIIGWKFTYHLTTNSTPPDADFSITINATGYETQQGAPASVVIYCQKASFRKYTEEGIPSDVNNAGISLKVLSNAYYMRICSPNYQGSFDVNIGKNNGQIKGFWLYGTYKPYTPYIKVAPVFEGLYGSNFGDQRGLICAGDFSLPRIIDEWQNYQLNNKNYQNIFNREIQDMEFFQSIEMRNQLVSGGIGILGDAAKGAAAGGYAGGPYGAAAGALIGGTASTIGYAIDVDTLARTQREVKQLAIDKFNYQLGNVKALPYTISKLGTWNVNSKIFPFLEYYTCTDEEKEALENKIRYESMTVMRIGTLEEFSSLSSELSYFKGVLIRNDEIADDTHILNNIYEELLKGVYI